MKTIKLTSEQKVSKANLNQLTGFVRTDLNKDWSAFKSSLSQVANFVVNNENGKAGLKAYCQLRGAKVDFTTTKAVIEFYKQFGKFERTITSGVNKGQTVTKVTFSTSDLCQAINLFIKSAK